jgi:hypothetical protein
MSTSAKAYLSDHSFIVGLRARGKAFTPASLGPRGDDRNYSIGVKALGSKIEVFKNVIALK